MTWRIAALVLPVAIGVGACGDDPVRPEPASSAELVEAAMAQVEVAMAQVEAARAGDAQHQGSGLILESLTGVTVPLIGLPVGDVVIDQAVLTNFAVVEDVAGAIVGLEAEGLLELSGGVLGTDVVTEEFRAAVQVASSGSRCRLITVDLGPAELEGLFGGVAVNLPVATVNTRSAGITGVLLCFLGRLVDTTITDRVERAIRLIVEVVNLLLI